MPSESSRNRLPFEPRQKKKKIAKTPPVNKATETSSSSSAGKNSAYDRQQASLSAIPDAVSKRMVKRMVLFSGIPTAMGISSFFVFYVIVSQDWFKVPNTSVVLTSMGLFGLGVLGLTYGILSTSWDENRVGSLWGWEEFKINFERMTFAWRSARKESLERKPVEND
jgi:hypothetical protein